MLIKKFLLISVIFISNITYCFQSNYFKKPFTIMLNPAGDAKDAGRMLNDSFERGVTLQFTQELKKQLEKIYPNIRVVITRIPGETLEPLQNANFSNRLDADFFLSVHFYKETETNSSFYLYHYLIEPFYCSVNPKLNFYTFDNAYLINISSTIDYASKFKKVLSNNIYKNKFSFKYVLGIPFKPLLGIKAPAIAIEIGLKNSNNYVQFIEPIIDAIGQIV